MKPWLVRAAAVVAPIAVIGGALAWLTRDPGAALSAEAQRVDALLAERVPELVLVGNSLVGHGVDEAALSEALGGVPTLELWDAATRPVNWYAVLHNRVFAAAHPPQVILVVTTPTMLLQTQLSSDKARKVLAAHVSDYEPVIDNKLYGRSSERSLLMHRLQLGRSDFQDWAHTAVRDASVGLIFGGYGDLLQRGRAVAEPAMQAVFSGDDAVDMSLHHRVIPVMQDEAERVEAAESRTAGVAESFVPDLIDLTEESGARLVLAWIPVSPKASASEALSPALTADLLGLLNARGVGWIDLHELPLESGMFKDSVHLNSQGRAVFTAALAESMESLGALSDRPMPPARLPMVLAPEVTRVGAPPAPVALHVVPARGSDCGLRGALPALKAISTSALRDARLGPVSPVEIEQDGEPMARGVGWKDVERRCDSGQFIHQAGFVSLSRDTQHPDAAYTLRFSDALPLVQGRDEGWWIYPETALRYDFERGPTRGQGRVQVWVQPFGAAAVTASVDGVPVALRRSRQWLTGEASLGGKGAWRLELRASGGFAAVRRLSVADGDQVADVVGSAERVAPARVSLTPRRWSETLLERGGPLELTALSPESVRGVGVASIGALAELGDVPVSQRVLCRFCSPLQVLEDGRALGSARLACNEVRAGLKGRYCTRDGALRFTSSAGEDPSASGARYTLALNPDRGNSAGWWLYPGDRQILPARSQEIRTLAGGGRSLILEGAAVASDPHATLSLSLRAGGELLLERQVQAAELSASAPLVLPIDPPLGPGARDVHLSLSASGYLLLTEVSISE